MVSKEEAKQEVSKLIEKYERIADKEDSYNEAMTKNDFIEPLFEALGWDVRNKFVEDEMTKEEKVSKGRVDYSFKINSIIKFFVEAKPLKVDIEESEPIRQAIDYAYHKGTRWVILTNFKRLIIFNAEWKRKSIFDNQFLSISYNDFIKDFDDLWLLSKESIVNGLLDKRAEKYGKVPIKKPISQQLLEDFILWRNKLSEDIQKRNKLTKEQIDEAVQRILDRLIFIRKCEDSELEEKKLKEIVHNWGGMESRKKLLDSLNTVFRYFDENYDSKIFQKHFSEDLDISDRIIEDIIYGLYYTKDKSIYYNFADIDADILGSIYEQYLGHILKSTPKGVKLKNGQSHRKEQGIYYTPTYIVDYIVKNTLGKLLEEKNIDVSKIRVLDSACGSGSFLIKAFDVLNDFYSKKDEGQINLESFARKIKILKDNIFGVDLDQQAVEIAQLNLLLKMAERKHRLPMLQENIKCGNSLIDDEKLSPDSFFKWEKEFPDIIQYDKEGNLKENYGFDVIIGNPPWLMAGYYLDKQLDFLRKKYKSAEGKFDLYYVFIELGLKLLSKEGYLGLIVPNKFFHTKSAQNLRKILSSTQRIYKIIDFGVEKIFGEATNYSSIILLRPNKTKDIQYVRMNKNLETIEKIIVDSNLLDDKPWHFESSVLRKIFSKIENQSTSLKNIIYRFGTGAQTGADKIYLYTNEQIKEMNLEKDLIVKILRGRDVRRCRISNNPKYAIFPYKKISSGFNILTESELKRYPKIFTLLSSNNSLLNKRIWFDKNAIELSGQWYGYMYLDKAKNFENECLITPSLSNISNFTLSEGNIFVTGTAGVTSLIFKKTNENIKYFLALLNSKLLSLWIIKHSPQFQGGYFKFSSNYLKNAPIRNINFKEKYEVNIYNEIVSLVDKMLSLNKLLDELDDKKTAEREKIEENIKRIDKEIDELVYKIYGITEEEKKTIEENLK